MEVYDVNTEAVLRNQQIFDKSIHYSQESTNTPDKHLPLISFYSVCHYQIYPE